MAQSFAIDTSQVKALARQYQTVAPEIVRQETKDGMADIGSIILAQARENISSKSGGLAKSGVVSLALGGRVFEVAVRFLAKYAGWVEGGRGIVVAKHARALRFEIDGEVLFRASVGPSKPVRYLARAVESTRGRVQARTNEISVRIARRIGVMR